MIAVRAYACSMCLCACMRAHVLGGGGFQVLPNTLHERFGLTLPESEANIAVQEKDGGMSILKSSIQSRFLLPSRLRFIL